jgi:hypothetical protein
MSHLGVARDICAWLNHHEQLNLSVKSPLHVNLQQVLKLSFPKEIRMPARGIPA